MEEQSRRGIVVGRQRNDEDVLNRQKNRGQRLVNHNSAEWMEEPSSALLESKVTLVSKAKNGMESGEPEREKELLQESKSWHWEVM